MIIEQKDNIKGLNKLKIGHSNLSETFRPEHVSIDALKLIFIDLAGFDDSEGMLVELINNFVTQ